MDTKNLRAMSGTTVAKSLTIPGNFELLLLLAYFP